LAAREDQDFITLNLFEKATERVMAGLEKRNMLTEE
jgi:ATP-dependent Zn protease